jgi:outer membrane protein assembly factor BamB
MNISERSSARPGVVLLMLAIALAAGGGWARAGTAANGPEETLAQQIVATSGVRGGLIVHVGCGDGRLTAALWQGSGYVVQGLDSDADRVRHARQHVQSAGIYGNVSIDVFDGRQLPYIDNLVNLLVVSGECRVAREEIERVLCPGGVAVRFDADNREPKPETIVRKPWPQEIDEWTHWLHGPDGNAVANDTVVGPPRRVQWVAEPRWQRHHEASPSISALVSSGGRLFAIINEAPVGIDGMPDRWVLIARDAFNGKLLWKRPIDQWGWSQWSDHSYGNGRWNHPTHVARRLVAVKDRVYTTLGFNAPLTALDASTGRTVMTYPAARFTDEILYDNDTLFLVVNLAAQGPGRLAAKPPVKKAVVALNAQTGEVLWKTDGFVGIASKADAIERITHLSMVLGSDHMFCIEEDAVVALNKRTGARAWRVDRPPRQRPVTYGSYYFTNLCSMVYHDGVVLFMEPDPTLKRQPWNGPAKSKLLGISADTGEVLWTRDCGMWGHYNQGDMFIIDNLAWVHDGQSFAMTGLDPHSGEVERSISTQQALDQGHHHRCYRNKATVRYIVTGRRGVEFINLGSGQNLRHHWTRGTCRYGVLPCNGLLYVPPHPCICYITAKLNGFWALRSTKDEGKRTKDEGRHATEEGQTAKNEGQSWEDEGRLQKGPAYEDVPTSSLAVRPSEDWPTYRHDAARSGCGSTVVPGELKVAWKARIGRRLSSPVIAGGQVFLASTDAHTVLAIGADDGKPVWSYTAGGRVDTPPTVHGPLVLFGSADGWVYCLRAADGQLVWRFLAAADDRRMVDADQLESPWPVHGNVLVQDGVAYFAAGRSSFLDGGIHVYAVDPKTGNVVRRNRIFSPDAETGDMVECKLPYDMPADALGALPDVFVGDGKKVYMRHLEFHPDDLAYRGASTTGAAGKNRRGYPAVGGHLMSVAGLLDDNWFNQTYWTVDGQAHSKLLVFDADAAYGVKPFPGNARHSRAIFRPGSKGYTLFANERPMHQKRWSVQVPVRVQTMVVAGSTLLVAGTPDVVVPDDPWAAFEGRKGGVLWAVSTSNGGKLAEYPLDSPPVFDGMAAAQGRLYISTTDGSLVCLQ